MSTDTVLITTHTDFQEKCAMTNLIVPHTKFAGIHTGNDQPISNQSKQNTVWDGWAR